MPPAPDNGFDFATLVGPELLTRQGPTPTAVALGGKAVVGLYFSAHWCPPCRGFTPELGKWYEERVKTDPSFEIVFVSSDKDEESFKDYYGHQAPWAALPFADRKTKDALSKKYKVRGIPSFVLVDGRTGEMITDDGRSGVMNDPAGFPWRPPELNDVLSSLKFSGKDGAVAKAPSGPLLLYFSAHWCPPCRGFTPQLVKFFAELKAAHADANIAFVSSDKDEAAFKEYYESMGADWLALPFAERGQKETLSTLFEVRGIPSLVLLSGEENGKRTVITTAGRACVAESLIADFPASWSPAPFGDLSKTAECKGASVNDAKALCLFADALDDADAAKAVAALKALATEQKGEETLFFYATAAEGIAERVKELTKFTPTDGKATLVLLDIPDDGGFYLGETDAFDAKSLGAFLAAPGERKQLQS